MSINELEIEYTSITTVKSCQRKVETSFEDFLGECWREEKEQRLLFESATEQLQTQTVRRQICLRTHSEQLEARKPAWTSQEEKLIAKFANNLQKIIERLAAEEKTKKRIRAIMSRYPQAAKFLDDPTVTLGDLHTHRLLFVELFAYLYDKTSYNPLLIDYEQLCVSRVLADVKQGKSVQIQEDLSKRGNCFKLFLKLLIQQDKFLTNMCELMRHPEFPMHYYDRKEIDYLTSLLPAKKKKKNKRKNKKKCAQEQSEEEQTAEAPQQPENTQQSQTLDEIKSVKIPQSRLQCSFSADFLKEIQHRIKHLRI